MKNKSGSILPILLLLLITGPLSSCGNFLGFTFEKEGAETVLKGRASKGPISGADVEVFVINPDGSTGESIGGTTTGTDGRYSIDLGTYAGPALIVLNGGQYRDEATGDVVQNELLLHTALPESLGKISAMVTPLTELAFRIAGPLTEENIQKANSFVSTLTGIDVLSCEPINPSDSEEAAGATNEQKSYSLLLAALSQMSRDEEVSVAAAPRIAGAVPTSMHGGISSILDNLEQDMADGDLNTTNSQLISGLVNFLESDQNNTGILNLDDTGLDEAINSGGISYSGVWYETDGESGEFTLSFKQMEDFFEGTFFVTNHGYEGQNHTFSIEGSRTENSYRGTDSLGREFIFELVEHPVTGSGNMLTGSYRDTDTSDRGSLRSTYNSGYNSAVGFVTIEGESDISDVKVMLLVDPLFSAVTNDHGFFILSGLPDGIHQFQASKEGFAPGDSGLWSFSDNATHHPNVNITLTKIAQNPPVAVTAPASNITTAEATLSGSVDPNNLATEAWFEWGESSTSLTNRTEDRSVGAGDTEVPIAFGIAGLDPGTTYYVRLVAENSAGTGTGEILPFTTGKPVAPPVATTQPATNITTGSAKLNGSVNPNDLPTESWFEWGTSSSSLTNSTLRQAAPPGSSSIPREFVLTGLAPGTKYYFRLVATNKEGKEEGVVLSFTTATPAVPPGASTRPATSIAIQSANVNGSANPNGFATQVWFEWGTNSSALSNSTPKQNAGSGDSSSSFHFGLSGLKPETTYYFRAVAENSGGTMKGETLSFKTMKLPIPPGAVTKEASSVTTDSARLNGSANPNGFATEAWFEWGTSSSALANRTSKSSIGSGSSSESFRKTISSLEAGTTYYFRVVAENSGGIMKGEILNFTTEVPVPPEATTNGATSITTGSATLTGSVNPNGFATEAWFEWGASSSSLGNKTTKKSMGSGTSIQSTQQTISSLASGTTYYFRAVAENSGGTMKGEIFSFITEVPALPPGASTLPASSITTNSASLTGRVNPNGFATEAWFEWGTSSSSLTNRTPKQNVGSGTSSQEIRQSLSGLSQGKSYYYRVVAASTAGAMKGSTERFTTETTEATLTWKAPTTNADGSLIDDLAGYKIYYGTSSGKYTNSVDVGNVTSYTLKNLPTGDVYFALTSYDKSRNESSFSAEGHKYFE